MPRVPSRAKRKAGSYEPSRALELRYARFIDALMVALQKEIWQLIEPRLESAFRSDALPPGMAEPFGILEIRFNGILRDDEITEEVAKLGKTVTRNNGKVLSRVLSIPINDLGITDEVLRQFISTNTALIKSLGFEQIEQAKQTIEAAAIRGERVENVTKQLQQQFSIAKSRARLIARDQLGKLNGNITKERHRKANVSEYVWTTAGDERVRESHSELDGQQFRWDTPPITNDQGDTNHPGEDIQCRCFAYPVI